MPVTSLSLVTTSLETLLRENIEHRMANAVTVNTSSVSPLDISPNGSLVNVFLFHLHPDGKPTTFDAPEVEPCDPRFLAKPVTLYFHLTAHQATGTDRHLFEQDLLGHALATLIDCSQLNDGTSIGGTTIFEDALLDNKNVFDIEIMNKSDVEAINVWAGHEGGAIEPSLYFKLKNVFLEPEQPQGFAGPILAIGSLVIPNFGPRIFSVGNTITVELHGSDVLVERVFVRKPAELFIGARPEDRILRLEGSSLDHFMAVELTLPVVSGQETFRVDFDANAGNDWAIDTVNGKVQITTDLSIERDPGGGIATLHLEPGEVTIRVFRAETLERGDDRIPTEVPSNRYAFTLHPHINDITLVVAGDRYQVLLDGLFDLTDFAQPPDTPHADFVRFAIGGLAYDVLDNAATLVPGSIAITGASTLDFRLAPGTDPGNLAFVQLWLRETVSQPFWFGGS